MAEPNEPETKRPSTSPGTEGSPVAASVDSTVALPPLDPGVIAALVGGYYPQPHSTLGQHPVDGGFVIRAIRPLAATVTAIRADGSRIPLVHVDQGLWQAFAPNPGQAYTLE
ncbi:MAG TPA: hypothetical protein VK537_09735, partial [Galbitalea sp.]|nr:hypothetical protein [Galbitalea sp.]